MNTDRNIQEFAGFGPMGQFSRKALCAVAALALTVLLLGEVGKSPAQAAQRAAAEQLTSEFAAF